MAKLLVVLPLEFGDEEEDEEDAIAALLDEEEVVVLVGIVSLVSKLEEFDTFFPCMNWFDDVSSDDRSNSLIDGIR